MESLKKRYRDGSSFVESLIHEWKSHLNADKVLILVEGKDDVLFYRKFFNSETSKVRDTQGCGSLKIIYDGLNISHSSHGIKNIAIKDADFERLDGTLDKSASGFFYTDAHDYEMMCLKNKQTQRELIENLIPVDCSEEIFNDIFEDLKYISYFKWYNYTNHLNYNFKGFSVAIPSKEQLCEFDFINELVRKISPRIKDVVTEIVLEKFITDHADCDIYELTCGHDFIRRFCAYLKELHAIQKTKLI